MSQKNVILLYLCENCWATLDEHFLCSLLLLTLLDIYLSIWRDNCTYIWCYTVCRENCY